MAIPIYRLFLFKLRLENYLISDQQRVDMVKGADEALRAVGGRRLLRIDVWSDERYPAAGVEEFPDLDALRGYSARTHEMLWPQYVDAETVIGIPGPWSEFIEQPPPVEQGAARPIFKLWMGSNTPPGFDSTPEDWEQYNQVNALAKELGVVSLLVMDSRPFSERWQTITVERYPTLETLQKVSQRMEAGKWWKFSAGRAYLGDAVGGLWSGF